MLIFKTYNADLYLETEMYAYVLYSPTNPNMRKGYRTLAYAMQVPQIQLNYKIILQWIS